MSNTSSDLESTVAKLEQQLRKLKITLGTLAVAAVVISVGAWTFPQDQSLTATRYLVLDSDGVPRGMFGVLSDGASVGMMFTDLSGNTRVEVGVDPEGLPRIALMDDQERIRTEASVAADGSARVVMADANEVARSAWRITNDGSAQLMFIDTDVRTPRAARP